MENNTSATANRLTLRLANPLNYEALLSTKERKANLWVDLTIQDSDDGTQARGDRDHLFLNIAITNQPDYPYLVENSIEVDNVQFTLTEETTDFYNLTVKYPSDPEILGFKILENAEWNLQPQVLNMITAFDDDLEDEIEWVFLGFDQGLGSIKNINVGGPIPQRWENRSLNIYPRTKRNW